jgi:prefoldin subunit 5
MRQSKFSFKPISILATLGVVVFLGIWRGTWKPTYRPSSPEIEQLAIATSMTPKAQQLFYQQDPKISPKDQFRTLCRKPEGDPEKLILLGCFTSNGYQGNIVIQFVSDPRLQGTMEVVAAHEMLHAAYQDLNPLERSRLEPKLRQAAKRVTDPNLLSVLKAYEPGDSNIYVNELHSHLGTSLEDLGDPELEQHYQHYFSDRQQVVALAQRSRRELNQLEAQADELKPEIDNLESDLKSQQARIQNTASELEQSIKTIDRMKSDLLAFKLEAETSLVSGDRSKVSQFNREQDRFNAEVRDYNAQVEEHRDQVTQYNQQVEVYKQKIAEYNQLSQTRKSILSSLQAESTVPMPQLSP